MHPTAVAKRLAFVISSSVVGGHEFQVVELVKLATNFCRPTVFLNRRAHERLFSGVEGIDVVVAENAFHSYGRLPSQVFHGLRHRVRYRKWFAGFDRVVVCAGAVEAGVPAGVGLLFTGKTDLYLPFLYDRAAIYGWFGAPYTWLLRVLLNLFGCVITINRIQARLISRCYRGRTFFVNNQISIIEPSTVEPGTARLVTIGRLDRQKRIPELIKALDYAENPYKVLLVIGDGPLRDEVRRSAEGARHIEVRLVGWLDAQQQSLLLSKNDVLVLNSVIEGEPMVIREANARGMRVIVPAIDGVRGVTLRANRFDTPSALREKISQAYLGQLAAVRDSGPRLLHARRLEQFRDYFMSLGT